MTNFFCHTRYWQFIDLCSKFQAIRCHISQKLIKYCSYDDSGGHKFNISIYMEIHFFVWIFCGGEVTNWTKPPHHMSHLLPMHPPTHLVPTHPQVTPFLNGPIWKMRVVVTIRTPQLLFSENLPPILAIFEGKTSNNKEKKELVWVKLILRYPLFVGESLKIHTLSPSRGIYFLSTK